MITRRTFVQGALYSGVLAGAAPLFSACSGAVRNNTVDPGDSGTGVLTDTARQILYLASLAPSGHNSQPWRVRIESPRSWIVTADTHRRLPAVDPSGRETMLSLGAFVENLTIAAGSKGFDTEVTLPGDAGVFREGIRITQHPDRTTSYPIHRLKTRRTVKHGHLPKELSARDIEKLFTPLAGCAFYFPRNSNHAGWIREAAVEAYRIQAARDEAQEELVTWLRLSDRQAREHRDGLSTAGMEFDGIKGFYLRHFADPGDFLKAAWRRKGVDMTAELASQGGGWIVITSAGTTPDDLINTGRKFQRMALLARELNIALHPMTQVLEEPEGLARIASNHGGNIRPQFVLRAGYLGHYPDPVSLRRPVSWFTT